ncbi:MAG: YggS family pyridoxal phosphate-dependent enzyme [Acidobacteria bacterium]|nr:YggS family pyridoxal phosphate-dependent enzyme [Acidobacteriota bacterium]
MQDTETRLHQVRERIASAAQEAGRSPGSVTLLAVTKTRPASVVQAGVDAGMLDLGENRVQEARQKIPEIEGNPRWHLIGSLQSKKTTWAAQLFDVIHSVDRPKLARRLDDAARGNDRRLDVYVQVDFVRSELSEPEVLKQARDTAEFVAESGHLNLVGLMTLPPYDADPEAARPWFRRLVALQQGLAAAGIEAPGLSMGMSNDFEVAIQEGSTIVRIGTSLFGPRTA